MGESMKLLSIIIPTYNMAALLPRCLDSLVAADGSNEYLETIIVNDGSKDNSLEVAKEYQKRYPHIVTVIDKPNGNYGSTINAALPNAKGKYIKILDSDDWFDTEVLSKYLEVLGSVDADMIITHFTQIGATTREVVRYNTMGREPYEYGKVYDLDEVLQEGYVRFFLMHALTYRAELLRKIGYRQTEGISYTDTEWACYPTFYAQTICFCNLNLYQYNLDREGQTMDPKVLARSVNQLQKVTDNMIAYYEAHIADTSDIRHNWLNQYFTNRIRILYKLYLLDMQRANFNPDDLTEMDAKYAPICTKYGWQVCLYPENKILRTEYIAYWHRHHKRWPIWYEQFNKMVDVVAKWFYVKFFRR